MKMFDDYRRTSGADAYMIGFEVDNRVFLIVMKELEERFVKIDRDSKKNGGRAKLRLKIDETNKKILLNRGAQYIGTMDEIMILKNKGDSLEKWIYEKNGQVWKKNSVAYYLQGDIEINGKQYQIKWENASLANEQTIAKGIEYKKRIP